MIVRLSNYGVRFRNYSGNFAIEIQFPKDWTIINPEKENVAFTNDDNNPGLCYYMCPISNDLTEVFDAINETIKYNEELKLKIELFKKKVIELQDIFAREPYEKLKELQFTTLQEKKKPGRPSKKTKEEAFKDKTNTDYNSKKENCEDIINDNANHIENDRKTSQLYTESTIPENILPDESAWKKTEEPSNIDEKIMEAVKNKKKRKK